MTTETDSYLQNLKNPKHLEDIKQLLAYLNTQLPNATQTMQYNMPTFEQNGQVVATLASQKNYMSLYMDMELVAQHREQLGDLNCGKSCIRFKHADDLPLDIISVILQETIAKQADQ